MLEMSYFQCQTLFSINSKGSDKSEQIHRMLENPHFSYSSKPFSFCRTTMECMFMYEQKYRLARIFEND